MLSEAEIKKFIDADKNDEKKKFAIQGQRYYEGWHDILKYKIYYIDADGKVQEDKVRSNIKIPHPFFTELVDQQVQYMLSGEGNIFSSNIPELQKELEGVDVGGSLDIKTVDIPYQARQAKLDLDEKNIYRFGMGFNSAQLGDGNITNIVIKSRYALLDLKCNKLQIKLKQFFRKLLAIVIDEINEQCGKDYQMKDVNFIFDREVMTNAQDNAQIELTDAQTQAVLLDNILKVNTLIDDETIVKTICDIIDVDYEEIKDRLPINTGTDLTSAQNVLNSIEVI